VKKTKMLNKAKLIKTIAAAAGLSQVGAEKAINGFTEVIAQSLAKNENVVLLGFGTFSLAKRASRKGRNPQTGESLVIEAKNVVRFKAGNRLLEAVAK